MRITYLVWLSLITFFLGAINYAISYWTEVRNERIFMMIISLFGVFVLFELLFEIVQGKKRKRHLIKYFVFSAVKISVILGVAYFFLNAKSIENRYEALFFLFNYLAFSTFDITMKVNIINKNSH